VEVKRREIEALYSVFKQIEKTWKSAPSYRAFLNIYQAYYKTMQSTDLMPPVLKSDGFNVTKESMNVAKSMLLNYKVSYFTAANFLLALAKMWENQGVSKSLYDPTNKTGASEQPVFTDNALKNISEEYKVEKKGVIKTAMDFYTGKAKEAKEKIDDNEDNIKTIITVGLVIGGLGAAGYLLSNIAKFKK
jgi:hypothetical protein